MKKLLLLFVALLSLCSCNRMRVKHDHSKHVQYARVPVDSAQKDSLVNEEKDENWKDEDLIVIPEEVEVGNSPSGSSDELERILRGEEVE